MKYQKQFILIFFVSAIALFSATGYAETTDELTPAEESICDPLKEEGATKGLYGLCVAFCEAQDLSSVSIPMTEERLNALAANAPSGSVLKAYNKKKTESDIPMPCIVVEPPCPCFTVDELTEIDGYAPDGSSLDYHWGNNSEEVVSHLERNEVISYNNGIPHVTWIKIREATASTHADGKSECSYRNTQVSPVVIRYLSNYQQGGGTITTEEVKACQDLLRPTITVHGH